MPLANAALNLMRDALAAQATHLSTHTADPGATGANPTAAARVAADWDTTDPDGDLSLNTPAAFTGGASGGACTHVGLWTANVGGTWLGGFALTGDTTFNAAGEYTVDDLTISGTAS